MTVTKLPICKWCKKPILSKQNDFTIKKNGQLEHYHKERSLYRDCFQEKLDAFSLARQILRDNE